MRWPPEQKRASSATIAPKRASANLASGVSRFADTGATAIATFTGRRLPGWQIRRAACPTRGRPRGPSIVALIRSFAWARLGSNQRPEDYESGHNRRPRPPHDIAPGRDVHRVHAVHREHAVLGGLMGKVMGNSAPQRPSRAGRAHAESSVARPGGASASRCGEQRAPRTLGRQGARRCALAVSMRRALANAGSAAMTRDISRSTSRDLTSRRGPRVSREFVSAYRFCIITRFRAQIRARACR
jgi:hypothetical protein